MKLLEGFRGVWRGFFDSQDKNNGTQKVWVVGEAGKSSLLTPNC